MKTIIIFFISLSGILLMAGSYLLAQKMPAARSVTSKSLAYDPYESYPLYHGGDLGVNYSKSLTVLKIWSPPAQEMKLRSSNSGGLA